MTHYGKEVLVALSGGLDSAAVVLFLREAGYRPRALFLDMLDSQAAREEAAVTASALDTELTVEPCSGLFRTEILGYALDEHAKGRTPAPCSRCNPRIKWRLLAQAADRLGIYHIATGHYVDTVRHGGHTYFRRGADPAKDQSYYLWDVPESLAERALLPLGNLTKAAVRDILKEKYGLTELAERRESMGVCFLGGLRYGEFLRAHLPAESIRPGEVVDLSGNVIGRHEGYPLYTAGQKRGFSLDVDASCGAAVIGIDAARNRVIVGPDEALHCRDIILKDWRAVCPEEFFGHAGELRIMVRGIGRNPQGGCRLKVAEDGRLHVSLVQDTAWALIAGQPVVFYLGDRVVGGGIIDEVLRH